MLNNIMPINELTNLVAVMQMDEDDKNLIIEQLNRYAAVVDSAFEALQPYCNAALEWIEDFNAQDEPDARLSPYEEEAWVGLTAMNGGEIDPRPDWYREMWDAGADHE
jgi:hypothetical protein